MRSRVGNVSVIACSTGRVQRPRPALLGLLAAGAVEVYLAHRTTLPGGIVERKYALLAEIMLWWVAFGCAVLCVRRLPRRTVVLTVLALAVVLRIAAVSERAPLSDDLYRYAWDGIVQHDGTNPYRYAPRADELADLRYTDGSDWLWPREWIGESPDSRINRTNVHTIYPPVAEAWFYAAHAVIPLSAEDRGYEALGFVVDLAVLAVLLSLLRSRGRDERWIALYALAPLPALEAVQNAHVDGLAVLAVLGALALWPRRPAWSAAVLCVAALIKIYPGILVLLMLRARDTRLRVLAAFTAVGLLAYLPHYLAIGTMLFGYLPGYLGEEKYDEGTRYLLVGLTGLSGTPATVVVLVALLALLVGLFRSDLPLETAGVVLLVGVFLLVTPVQPWYSLLLIALATLTGAWWAVPVAIASYPLFFATILGAEGPALGRVSYGIAALVVLLAYLRSRRTQPVPAIAAGRPG